MTADHQFLKRAHIEACEIAEPLWMTWRAEEIAAQRMLIEDQGRYIAHQSKRLETMKLITFAGWIIAALLFLIPVIERLS